MQLHFLNIHLIYGCANVHMDYHRVALISKKELTPKGTWWNSHFFKECLEL